MFLSLNRLDAVELEQRVDVTPTIVLFEFISITEETLTFNDFPVLNRTLTGLQNTAR